MLAATESSIRALSEYSSEAIIDGLASTKLALEHLYKSDEGQFAKEEILKDLAKIVGVLERLKATSNFIEKRNIFFSEYQPLSNHLRDRYSDFLPAEVIRKMEANEMYMQGFDRLINAQAYMLLAFRETNPVDLSGKLYTGMVNLSKVLERYINYFPKQIVESTKNIALGILTDSSLQPEQPNLPEAAANYLLTLRNTARGVLWQLDNYQKLEGYKKPFQETTLADVAGCLKYTGEPKPIDELNMGEN
ncbi:MAG: hypothetical protein AB1861_05960 [Cyanobacteriota bacterium]